MAEQSADEAPSVMRIPEIVIGDLRSRLFPAIDINPTSYSAGNTTSLHQGLPIGLLHLEWSSVVLSAASEITLVETTD